MLEAEGQPRPRGDAAEPKSAGNLALGLALLLAAWLVFFGLGASDLQNRDEARHALIAENVLTTGDWLTLHLDGQPYFNKPPLRFWLSAVAFRICGVNALCARFWSAVFAIAAVGLTGLIGRRLYGPAAGAWSALVLATTPLFLHVHCARSGETDSLLLACLALAAWLGLRAAARPRDAVLAGVAAGLCGLTKHLGFVPVALILVAAAAETGRRGAAGGVVLRATLAAAAVALPWHALMALRHGGEFLQAYFGRELAQRAFAPPAASRGPLYVVQTLKDGFWPWAALAPWGALGALSVLRRAKRAAPDVLPLAWLSLLFTLVVIARVKLPWYALPLLPPLALLTGRALARPAPAPGRDWTWPAWAGTGLLLLTSPVAWTDWAPSTLPALDAMPRVDLLGLLQGAAGAGRGLLPALCGLGAASLAALAAGRGVPRGARLAKAWRQGAAIGLAVTALGLAAAPLRFAARPSPLAVLTARAAALCPGDTLLTVIDPPSAPRDDRLSWLLRRQRLAARRLPSTTPPPDLGPTSLVLGLTGTPAGRPPDGAAVLGQAGEFILYRRPAPQ